MTQLYHEQPPERLPSGESLHSSIIPHFQPVSLPTLTPETVKEIFTDSADRVFEDFVRTILREGLPK